MKDIIIYNTQDGKSSVSLLAKDGMVWMNQIQLAELFVTTKQNISLHIQNIFEEDELDKNSVVKEYLTTANDGKDYSVLHYSLEMVLAIGFRVRSKRGTQFRQWANKNLKEYMIKGFIFDDERLKNPDGKPDYFDELLERIRDIRASEKRFYQKVKELFMLSSDYDSSDKSTQLFFAQTQNKLLYSITGQTAAEIIINRADEMKPNMALTSFKGTKVRKEDIYIAKNYLNSDELDSLNRFVIVFLETAELRAKNKEDITMDFWRENIDRIIEFNDKKLLKDNGSISTEQMKKIVEKVYETFDNKRKKQEAIEADYQDLEELQKIEEIAKKRL
ncbi:virulence RhuM family protein [Aliarcobacter butzleri]|uniref:virulence RhuM family protein n=1 Tax=Aliarcobacter butzleri TaxID=28197 RepID=UPI0021B38B05|nr:virulence RhuM family protein [Aliarcobacter butzleri]MCT7550536.1 virulence RhuM family protein [Aliarcobacter butzleri]MCT7559634.1 virulence RhuM family protein [Aliarcobacter butzleri]